MIFMVKEHIFGLIRGYIKDNGRKTKCMEKDKLSGKMAENILE
jgi:hypothetical protein